MSVITELVIHTNFFYASNDDAKVAPDNLVRRFGRALYEGVHEGWPTRRPDPDYWYRPLPDELRGVQVNDGGKWACNAVWWLAVNGLDFEALVEYLADYPEFHGVTISYDQEHADGLQVHTIGQEVAA